MSTRILVVDDEVGMQVALREVLVRLNYEVDTAQDALAALELLEQNSYSMVITDVRMPEMTGMELLDRIRSKWPQMLTLVMTAYGTIEDAVEAMKKGAADYLLKPFSSETIEQTVHRLLASRKEVEKEAGEEDEGDSPATNGTGVVPIARSHGMQQVLDLSRQVADSMATILIQGESGTGKEVVAHFLHNHSSRKDRPFVAVNCAALPENLLESELFGHEKGAFTGAVLARKGKFELANHGTILLDEISEMPVPLQAKLLRVLQERVIDPIGAQRPIPLDVRVIATTNRNLASYVQEGKFREDLFYRLQVITLMIPALRERREDILPLSEYFVRRHCRVNKRPRKKLSNEMRDYLFQQPWRGNVRELENFLERAVLLCQGDAITPGNIYLNKSIPAFGLPAGNMAAAEKTRVPEPENDGATGENQPAQTAETAPSGNGQGKNVICEPGELVTLEEMERRLIMRTLDQVNGNRTRAADLLGVSVRTIRNKLALYNNSDSEDSTAVASA
ncbi:MAG: sigma-54-dependent transcriptional regulator [Candidatus Sumerlaeia bacterium]